MPKIEVFRGGSRGGSKVVSGSRGVGLTKFRGSRQFYGDFRRESGPTSGSVDPVLPPRGSAFGVSIPLRCRSGSLCRNALASGERTTSIGWGQS